MDDFWSDEPVDWFDDEKKGQDAVDDDGDDDVGAIAGAQHSLVLLDCGNEMFQKLLPDPDFPADQISPFDYAIQACEAIARQQIRTTSIHKIGRRNAFGILLYNTRNRIRIAREEENSNVKQEGSPGITKQQRDGDDSETDDDGDPHVGYGPVATTVHEFVETSPPGLATVRRIRKAMDIGMHGRQLDLEALYRSPGGAQDASATLSTAMNPLQLAFHEATQILNKVGKKTKPGESQDRKQLCIFTNHDDPCRDGPAQVQVLQKLAQDVSENGIEIVLVPLPKSDKSAFDYTKFYDRLRVATPLRGQEQHGMDLNSMAAQFLRHFWKKASRTSAIPLLLPGWKEHRNANSPDIMVDLFRLVRSAKTPPNVVVHNTTGRVLSKVTQTIPTGGGEILAEFRTAAGSSVRETVHLNGQSRIRTYVSFGNDERAPMSYEDAALLKKATNAAEHPSLMLVGFKRKDAVPFYHAMEDSYLVYPSDDWVEGSCCAFANLHASMIRKEVLAIGELLLRQNGSSRLVALWPLRGQDPLDETSMSSHSGLLAVPLPFEDWIRAVEPAAPLTKLEDAQVSGISSDPLVESLVELVQKQTLRDAVIGGDFENAYLSEFWKYVELSALSEKSSSDVVYDTIINEDEVRALVGGDVEKVNTLLPEDVAPVKMPRKREIQPDESGVDWLEVSREGSLDKCTMSQLKSYLKSVGEPCSGRKDDLVERVRAHLEHETTSKRIKMEDL